jgi:hypothetical protein
MHEPARVGRHRTAVRGDRCCHIHAILTLHVVQIRKHYETKVAAASAAILERNGARCYCSLVRVCVSTLVAPAQWN